MIELSAEKVYYFFDPKIEPMLTVDPGEIVRVETADSASGLVRSENDIIDYSPEELEKKGIQGADPVTGPIAVRGAEPGDCLSVEIREIRCANRSHQGFVELSPGFGGLSGPYSVLPSLRPSVKICPITEDFVIFPVKNRKPIAIPLRPIVGTIGVAPRTERIATLFHGQEFGGNIDSPDAIAGNRMIFRVNVKGGNLSLGDVAAVTGDGELCVSHIDTEGEVTIKIDLIKRENTTYLAWPQIDYPDRIGSIACPMAGSLDDAYKAAYHDLTMRLAKFYGFDVMDAYQLLSSVGEVRINQGIDPYWYSCVAKVAKRYIE